MNPKWYYWKLQRDTWEGTDLKLKCQKVMDDIRRQWNRELLKPYQTKSHLSADFVETADEVFIERGRRKYYPEMEE